MFFKYYYKNDSTYNFIIRYYVIFHKLFSMGLFKFSQFLHFYNYVNEIYVFLKNNFVGYFFIVIVLNVVKTR